MNRKEKCKKEDKEKIAVLTIKIEKLMEALNAVYVIERRLSDAWCGGHGEANLSELSEIGRIAHKTLSIADSELLAEYARRINSGLLQKEK